MFHINHTSDLLFGGGFGLEKESLRINGQGYFARSAHPFPDSPYIVRDFCENQLEINTGVSPDAEGAIRELEKHTEEVLRVLDSLDEPEYLWRFSNPPYIKAENDIPVAQFTGKLLDKTIYRNYLSKAYGKYKMTLSGIHVNYSFSDELLQKEFALSGERNYRDFKDSVYLHLAKNLTVYGWLVTLLLASSPLSDSSYFTRGELGKDAFVGMASVRCSEIGYWNNFTPILDYDSVHSYAESIRDYIHRGLIKSQTELYYPIRLKPKGENKLETLEENGINHIEIRNVDLNPFEFAGLDLRDLKFIQLLILFSVCQPAFQLTKEVQKNAVNHFKKAAHYDINSTLITMPDAQPESIKNAALKILDRMDTFFKDISADAKEIIAYQKDKLLIHENRYAVKVLKQFSDGYVKKGIALAKNTKSPCLNDH